MKIEPAERQFETVRDGQLWIGYHASPPAESCPLWQLTEWVKRLTSLHGIDAELDFRSSFGFFTDSEDDVRDSKSGFCVLRKATAKEAKEHEAKEAEKATLLEHQRLEWIIDELDKLGMKAVPK